jgi:DNA polymerase
MYKVAASGIYGIKYEAVTKEQRFIGKVAELALGYQGGVNALQQMARAYGVELDEDLAQTTVSAWREANAPIKNFWYSTEEAAINAVSHPATTYTAGRLQFNYDRQTDFLRIKLPSNRLLCYYQPVLIDSLMPWGEYKQQLNFTGVNQVTRNIEVSSTYGGKIVENITQAVARDVLAANLPKVEAAGFEVIGSVHDEIITLAPEDSALDHQTLSALLATQPEWADGLPLAAEGYTSVRYQK